MGFLDGYFTEFLPPDNSRKLSVCFRKIQKKVFTNNFALILSNFAISRPIFLFSESTGSSTGSYTLPVPWECFVYVGVSASSTKCVSSDVMN